MQLLTLKGMAQEMTKFLWNLMANYVSGNCTLCAHFGHRHSHNEELCVASCSTIIGHQRFYGSEALNGVRVRVLFRPDWYYLLICYTDIHDVHLPDKKFTSRGYLARQQLQDYCNAEE